MCIRDSDTSSAVASSLGGRNSTVLLARDILYRVCELSANTKANYDQSRDLFLNALKTIQALGAESQATQFSKIGTSSTINETLGFTKSSSNTTSNAQTKTVDLEKSDRTPAAANPE